jgi:hypothetical protein
MYYLLGSMSPLYWGVVIISLVLGGITQAYIRSTYDKWSRVPSGLGATGAEVARRMLNDEGASQCGIGHISGHLTDNYNPRENVLHLSDENFHGGSVSSVAVACHEAGHAVVMHALPTHDPVHQITIVPRGQAGGMTISLPEEDRSYRSRREMEEEIVSLLGGRVAEAMMLGDISTGASNDIQRASRIARKMVAAYGMSETLGAVSFETGHDEIFIGREMARSKGYSEAVAAQIDAEVKRVIDAAYRRCEQILARDRDKLVEVAEFLLLHETMSGEEFASVFVQTD